MGAWIETLLSLCTLTISPVAPRVGAWIETYFSGKTENIDKSHPVWVRGLKLLYHHVCVDGNHVAPRVGAWIETKYSGIYCTKVRVAPRVGAWIETLAVVYL